MMHKPLPDGRVYQEKNSVILKMLYRLPAGADEPCCIGY